MIRYNNEEKKMNSPAKLLLSFFAVLMLISSLSCSNDPIFATIENEVPLRDPSFRGSVDSLVQFNNYLYACNGTLKRKAGKARAGQWYNVSLPSGAYRCSALAVTPSGNMMYAVFQNSEWKFHSLQKFDGTTWTKVNLGGGITSVDTIGTSENGIYTVTPHGSGGDGNHADYYTICTVNASDNFTTITGTVGTPTALTGKYIVTKSGSDGDGHAYNVTGGTATDISGKIDSVMGGCSVQINGQSHLYVLTRYRIYHYDESGYINHRDIRTSYDGFGNPAYYSNPKYPDKPLLLLPLEEGYREATIDTSSGDVTGTSSPGDEIYSSTAPGDRSQYDITLDDYTVTAIFAVTDPDYLPDGDSHAVYMSIGHYKYDGLWSYYSDTESEWNRE